MAGLNKVMIIGNVGTDPEMKYTANGNPVTTFRIASSRTYTTPEGNAVKTEWFNVRVWRKGTPAQRGVAYVEDGCARALGGQDGQKRFRTEVIASTVLFPTRAGAPLPGGAVPGGVSRRTYRSSSESHRCTPAEILPVTHREITVKKEVA
jgi:single-strand DNA-binding protein